MPLKRKSVRLDINGLPGIPVIVGNQGRTVVRVVADVDACRVRIVCRTNGVLPWIQIAVRLPDVWSKWASWKVVEWIVHDDTPVLTKVIGGSHYSATYTLKAILVPTKTRFIAVKKVSRQPN